MTYGDVCTGISAPTVAWGPLGWKAAWYSEIAGFPCRLLRHHYPHTPNLGDMLKIHEKKEFKDSIIDVLIGGTPCQSFSTAGLRRGLADARGNLALQFCILLTIKRPRWFIWENVPGVLSVEGGRAFQAIITGFRNCGYSLSWRTMDAQFFGVPQRRRRIFVVGHLGDDWRPSAGVLFEPEGLCRNTSPRQSPRTDIAGTLGVSTGGRSIGAEEAAGGMLIFGSDNTQGPIQVAPSLNAHPSSSGRLDFATQALIMPRPTVWSIMPQNSGRDYKAREVQVAQPVTTQLGISNNGGDIVQDGIYVRRFTPLEAERLQGFPDGYTAIPKAKDSPRYQSLGNSMATPVIRWLGQRIEYYDKIFSLCPADTILNAGK